MDTLVERCAGLDVHRDTVVATVRVPGERGGRRQETRTFGAVTGELLRLRDWLDDLGVTLVGMEATGTYWKPVFYVLEESVECWLLNAQHLRNVPGRKTDVADSAWICQLVEHGLVRPSFVPPAPIRELRDLTRYRKAQIEERTRAAQRLDKVLQDAGIKLSSVASSTLSLSAKAMLEALCGGETDPEVLADMAKARMRSKIPQLREALPGPVPHRAPRPARGADPGPHLLAHIAFLDELIAALDERIEEVMVPFAEVRERVMTIPGVKARVADMLIAECGVDMSRFPSAGHLASWAGICPGNNESGGKHRSGKTRKGSKWLRPALTEAAQAAGRARDTYLAAHQARIRGRRGKQKAIGATRHDILVAYYHIVRDGVPFRELGPDWLNSRNSPEHRTRRLVRQLEALGHNVTLDPTEVA